MEQEAGREGPKWTLLLIDKDIPDAFAQSARRAGLARRVIFCGERAAAFRLAWDKRAVFVLSASRPCTEIERFVRSARPRWRSGLIVGPGNNQLAYQAYQLFAFADYIVPPYSEEQLRKTGDHLSFLAAEQRQSDGKWG